LVTASAAAASDPTAAVAVVVVVVVVVVRKLVHGALITESLVRRHLGCPYANKNVFSNQRNSPSSLSGRRSSDGKLFQIRGPAAGKLRSHP